MTVTVQCTLSTQRRPNHSTAPTQALVSVFTQVPIIETVQSLGLKQLGTVDDSIATVTITLAEAEKRSRLLRLP